MGESKHFHLLSFTQDGVVGIAFSSTLLLMGLWPPMNMEEGVTNHNGVCRRRAHTVMIIMAYYTNACEYTLVTFVENASFITSEICNEKPNNRSKWAIPPQSNKL